MAPSFSTFSFRVAQQWFALQLYLRLAICGWRRSSGKREGASGRARRLQAATEIRHGQVTAAAAPPSLLARWYADTSACTLTSPREGQLSTSFSSLQERCDQRECKESADSSKAAAAPASHFHRCMLTSLCDHNSLTWTAPPLQRKEGRDN